MLEAEDRLETADVLRAGSDAQAIRDWLRERTEDRLMIVGHNPGLTDLIALLVVGERRRPAAPGLRAEERRDRRAAALGCLGRPLRARLGRDAPADPPAGGDRESLAQEIMKEWT